MLWLLNLLTLLTEFSYLLILISNRVSALGSVTDQLKALGIDDPWHLEGFSQDLHNIPDFGLYDIFNYLLCSRADYDRKKLKAYTSFEDFWLHVELL